MQNPIYLLTLHPGTDYEIKIGAYSSIEKAFHRIGSSLLKDEFKTTIEDLNIALDASYCFKSQAVLVERFYID